MAPVLATRCGGNPFYITAVVQRSLEQNKPLESEEQINEILAVDLSSGFIRGELSEQVNRWIERINEHGTTRWIFYLSALEEGERIDPERIRRELWEREGPGLRILRLWFFCHGGFTPEAQALMVEDGILWSDSDDLNALLAHVGLKLLPEIDGEDTPEEAE